MSYDRVEALKAAVEGECDGLALSDEQARNILDYLASAQAASAEPRNQCDGCQAGMPMRGDLHTDSAGRAVMACQKDRYTTTSPAGPDPTALQPALRRLIDSICIVNNMACWDHAAMYDLRDHINTLTPRALGPEAQQ